MPFAPGFQSPASFPPLLASPSALWAIYNGFETGTNGVSLTTANTGDSLDTACSAVSIGTGTTLQFSSTQANSGSLSMAAQVGSTSTAVYGQWSFPLSNLTAFRFYVYLTANPVADDTVVMWNNNGSRSSLFAITATGPHWVYQDNAFNESGFTMTSAIPLNQWTRLDGYIIWGAGSTGTLVWNYYATASSTTPTETHSFAGTVNTGPAANQVQVGWPSGGHASQPLTYWDDIGVSNSLLAPVTPVVTITGGAALTGSGSLTAAVTVTAPAALSGSGSESDASTSVTAPASLSGSGTLSTAVTVTIGTSLTGSGTLSAAAKITAPAALSGSGTLSAVTTVTAGAALSGSGTMSNSATVTAPASLSGSGTMTSAAAQTAQGTASLSGSGILSAVTKITAPAALSGSGTLGATASLIRVPENLGANLTYANNGGTAVTTANTYGGTLTLVNYGGGAVPVTIDAVCTPVTIDGAAASLANAYGGTLVLADYDAATIGWTMQQVALTLAENNDETVSVAITQNGSPLNLTTATVNMYLKTAAGAPDGGALLLSSGGGSPAITITNASGGLCSVAIPRADLTTETYTFYRIDVVFSGLQNTAIYGVINWVTL